MPLPTLVHPTLRHPLTGAPLYAVGDGRRGPIWPVLGGADTDDDEDPDDDGDDKDGAGKDGGDKKGSEKDPDDKVPPAVRAALRKANKEAETLRKELKELKDKDKSETEKATDRATVAEKRAEEAEARALRLEVAAEKGLTLAQAKRLVGSTKEELEEDADELIESFGGAGGSDDAAGKKPAGGRPKEKLKPGRVPDADDDEPNMDQIADAVFKGSRGG